MTARVPGSGVVTEMSLSSRNGGVPVPTARNDRTSLVLVGMKLMVACIQPLKYTALRV